MKKLVTPRLDRGVHLEKRNAQSALHLFSMDAPVKPGHDGVPSGRSEH
jgi:hypothetical protein